MARILLSLGWGWGGGRAPFDLLCVGVQLGLTFLVLEEGQAALLSKKDWAVLVDGPSVFILCS